MSTRKPFRVETRVTTWENADGTKDDVVKLYGGTRGSMALDYSEVPRLIVELARLLHEQQRETRKDDQ